MEWSHGFVGPVPIEPGALFSARGSFREKVNLFCRRAGTETPSRVEQDESSGPDPPSPKAIPRSHLGMLFGMISVYTIALTYLCQLRYDNFFGAAFDMGVNQQLLWTGSHGYLLYETPDLVTTGIHSFLEIHSTYIAFLVAVLYGALPYSTTLFAVQSAVLSSSVIPLYLIARRGGLRAGLVFPALGLFLVNFGIVSALLFDFHWEAFLPMELLWFYFLVRRKSYSLALLPMVAGLLTLEIYPFLALGVLLFLLYEKVRELGLRPRRLLQDGDVRVYLALSLLSAIAYAIFLVLEHQVIPDLVGTSGETGVYSGVNPSFTILATSQTLSASAIYWILLLAGLGFFPLFSPKSLIPTLPWFVEATFLQPFYTSQFGNQYVFIVIATLAIAYIEGFSRLARHSERVEKTIPIAIGLLGGSAVSEVLAFGNSSVLLRGDAGWLIVLGICLPALGLLAYLSLTARTSRHLRALRAGSMATDLAFFALVAGLCDVLLADFFCLVLDFYPGEPGLSLIWLVLLVPPLCAAFLGLSHWSRSGFASWRNSPGNRATSRAYPEARPRMSLWIGIIVLLIGFNVALSPLNPVNESVAGSGYLFEITSNPVAGDMGWIVDHIPENAPVLAVGDLFPFAADNPNAWPALESCTNMTNQSSCAPSHLPFNGSNLPEFVLTDVVQWPRIPPVVLSALLNRSTYGLAAEIYSGGYLPGSVYLFERGFAGAAALRYASAAWPPYFGSARDLNVGPAGTVANDPQSRFGEVLESKPSPNPSGNESVIWSSAYIDHPPGLYLVTYNLSGSSPYSSSQPDTPVLRISTGQYTYTTPAPVAATITAGELGRPGWTDFEFVVPLLSPYPFLDPQGLLCYSLGQPNGNVTLNFIEVTPL